ncbi:putative transposase [Mycobacterium xenopi 4042]|uniref:Putative transposase n=1 Tax=Mycobacterium xenopi 4042 TaxID=1299334 RepID=X8BJR3_MYCXE|nr:putative transposase [Mycobacterium xenopi 4042]
MRRAKTPPPGCVVSVWRYHPFVTNSALPVDQADITTDATPSSKHLRRFNRRPTGTHPVGAVAANCAWLACAVIAHNLLRAVGTLAGGHHAVAPGTLRRDLINIPARFAARPQTNAAPTRPLALASQMEALWHNVIGYPIAQPAPPDPPSKPVRRHPGRPRNQRKAGTASGSPTPTAPHSAHPKTTASTATRNTHPRIQA